METEKFISQVNISMEVIKAELQKIESAKLELQKSIRK